MYSINVAFFCNNNTLQRRSKRRTYVWMEMKPAGGAVTEEATRNMAGNGLKSPIPAYFFGGLGIIFTLISVALLLLACSHRKHSSSSTQDVQQESKTTAAEVDSEPKINVVVMAGETSPTFLAKPQSWVQTHAQQQSL